MDNPYAAPRADLETLGDIPIYSPRQVMTGAFLGGPVGLIWFLRANFLTLGDDRLARNSLIFGAILILALLLILPMLPPKFPSQPITLAYMIAGQQIAIKLQMTREAISTSTRFTFQSNWRVVGLGLLCLVVSVILLVGPMLLLDTLRGAQG